MDTTKIYRRTCWLVSLYLALLLASSPGEGATPAEFPFRNISLSWEERAVDLASRLTLGEVVAMLARGGGGSGAYSPGVPRLGVRPFQYSTVCWGNGVQGQNATGFLASIGLGATFSSPANLPMHSPAVVGAVARAAAVEARGVHHGAARRGHYGTNTGPACLGPFVNIVHHPLWGRIQEVYGEDPYHSGELGAAWVGGAHGDHPRYRLSTAACVTLAAYSGPENIPVSRFSFNAKIPAKDLSLTYLPHFARCVAADVDGLMCSYTAVNGVPSCANRALLDGWARRGLGFRGWVMSDETAIEDTFTAFNYTHSLLGAAATCLNAGVNLEQPPPSGAVFERLEEAVQLHLTTERTVRSRLVPLLVSRLRMGEFDPPRLNPYSAIDESVLQSAAHRALAVHAAAQSFVLLKNSNTALPVTSKNSNTALPVTSKNSNTALPVTSKNSNTALPVTSKNSNTALPVTSKNSNTALPVTSKNSNTALPVTSKNSNTALPVTSKNSNTALPVTSKNSNTALPVTSKNINTALPVTSKNSNTALPVTSVVPTVAVVGPFIDDLSLFYGGYGSAVMREFGRTPYAALRSLGRAARAAAGCESPACTRYTPGTLRAAVTGADLIFVCIGTGMLEHEGSDRRSLTLPGNQSQLLRDATIYGRGARVVVLSFSPGPVDLSWAQASPHVHAILQCFLPAQATGDALYRVIAALNDDVTSPAGRLSITWPKSLSQIPPMTQFAMTGQTYRYFKGSPLYPFGYGLSYTSFRYSNLWTPTSVKAKAVLKLNVTVTNTGPHGSDEVTQVYISWSTPPSSMPQRQLVAFKRHYIPAASSSVCTFIVTSEERHVWQDGKGLVAYEGVLLLSIGGQQPDQATRAPSNVLTTHIHSVF